MKRIITFILMLSFFLFPCFSQESENDNRKNIDGTTLFQPIRTGDKFMKIGLSLGIPLFHSSNDKIAIKTNTYPGGTIDAGFSYYLIKGFSLGGSLSFQFYPTLARNLYFAVPITFDLGYTFAAGKWRIPLGAGIGGAFQSYNGNGGKYFGMVFRFDTEVYYQYFPEWSFGGGFSWSVRPQWYSDTKDNRTGNFFNIKFAARYHF